jgi:simple sugar transport system ATP-binding protein
MDEPTSVLTPQESEKLFETLRVLAAEGCAILYISHKLAEIAALCDRTTVMRAGRVVGSCDPRRESPRHLAELMIGTTLPEAHRQGQTTPGDVRLAVAHLETRSVAPYAMNVRDASFEVRAGEILGIAGLAGSGQAELLAALSGEAPSAPADAIRIDGRPAGALDAAARRALGLAFVPEERLGRGAVPPMTLADNAVLTGWRMRDLARGGWIDRRAARREADAVIGALDVKARGAEAEAGSLSGGNLQKFIVGREIAQAPGVMIVAQPTWGVDAGAAAAIHQRLFDLAAGGAAVLVVSQDLDELFLISDRIAVLCAGRLSPARPRAELTVEQVGLLMGGLFDAA